MLFFQIALTEGYAYSNWLVRNRRYCGQTRVHLILLAVSVILVIYLWTIWPSPITPDASWRPDNVSYPILKIFALLLITANISNVRLDLRPVFWQLAQYYDLEMAVIENPAGAKQHGLV